MRAAVIVGGGTGTDRHQRARSWRALYRLRSTAAAGRERGQRAIRLAVGLAALASALLVGACGTTVAQSRLTRPDGVVGAAPATTLAPSLRVLSQEYLAQMSLDEKLGQLFLAEFVGPNYTPDNAAFVEQLHAGGILLYNREMPTYAGTRALIAAAQAHSRIPLFVVVDEEGGWVDRLSDIYGFRPSASMIAATGSPAFARSEGARAAHDMTSLGLNFDLAPDVDVALVNGPDQSTRTFGSTPEAVTTFAGAYLDGLQSNHVVGCLKHFPGLGAATTDAHLGLPIIYRSREQIEQVELAPYRNLIEHNAPGCVMSTDLLMPALDPNLPAELSPAIMTGVLRDELGFDGVVVTDALYMQGIANQYSMPEAGVLAILAGSDFLMGPWWPSQMAAMIGALKAALASGRLTMARIDQSVRRILELKLRFGLLPQTLGTGPTDAQTDAQVPITPAVALAPTTRRRGTVQREPSQWT